MSVIVGYSLIAVLALLFFAALVKTNRQIDERTARIEAEERRIREDAIAMRSWFNSRRINVEGESEAEIAERFVEMIARS